MIKYLRKNLLSEHGAVAVEAIIILPLLIFMYGASMVWFDAFRHQTLTLKASYAVSDVLSREAEVDNAYLDNMHRVFRYMISSDGTPHMRVSMIRYNEAHSDPNKYRLAWSYSPSGQTELTQDDLDRNSNWIPIMGNGETVVVLETQVYHKPIMDFGLLNRDKETGEIKRDEPVVILGAPLQWDNVIVTRPRFHPELTNLDVPEDAANVFDLDDEGDGDPTGSGGVDDGGDYTPGGGSASGA